MTPLSSNGRMPPRCWTRAQHDSPLRNLRKELRIDLLNEAGQPVFRFFVHSCWVSEYQALPDLDAGANAIAIEHIRLENHGWERHDATEPAEI